MIRRNRDRGAEFYPGVPSHTTVHAVPHTAVPDKPRLDHRNTCRPISAQPYLAASGHYFRRRALLRGICSELTESRFCSACQVQPFTDRLRQLLRRLLTSANPSLHLTMQLAPRQVGRSPRVRRVTFIPHTRRIYFHTFPDGYRASGLMAPSPRCGCLVCGSCSSGRDFACNFLQIPGRPESPCCSANGSRHQGP